MLVEDSQCTAYVTEFGSQSVNVALIVVQGLVSFASILGSLLLILSYVLIKQLRTKSRLLITHLAAANLLQSFPDFLAVFMNFSTRFKVDISAVNTSVTDNSTAANITNGLTCSGDSQFFDRSASVYCSLCVWQGFVGLFGVLSSIFWTLCVCIHLFILVSYRKTKLASHATYVYYVFAWLVPLGICLWLLFHNWLGFEPTYSTVNCGIRTSCVPDHHPYHYQRSYDAENWNRIIGVLFGLKIWQLLAFVITLCLFIAIQYIIRKDRTRYVSFSSTAIREVERNILLIPIIFMVLCTASFVSDLYFYINHKKNLKNLQSSNAGIIFVHFLTRIFDNSYGVINFCLFCVFTREVRVATKIAVQRVFSKTSKSDSIPPIRWFTSSTANTSVTSRYGALFSSQEHENPLIQLNN